MDQPRDLAGRSPVTPQAYRAPGQGYPGPVHAYDTSTDPSLAQWWQRLLGWLVDSVIIGVIFDALLGSPLATAIDTFVRRIRAIAHRYPGLGGPAAHTAIFKAEKAALGTLLLAGLAGVAIALAYYWLQHALWGRTIGKRALRTAVVTASGRSKIGAGAAGIRAVVFIFGPVIPFMGLIFWLLDNLWLLWDPRRQCVHDKAAGTVVIRTSYRQIS